MSSDGLSHSLTHRLGAILWPSFFSASVATVVFFIFVDPLVLRDMTFPTLEISRQGGYTIAFFLFWIATASASTFTWLLLKPTDLLNKKGQLK